MATTTNYGWTTPDDTDLVKDGAAAIRTLGSSVDTTTKALNPSTTTGDIEYRSATANTNTRLALGTAGQVLTVNSGATAPEWATPASGGMTLISTTTLSGASTTINSFGGYVDLQVIIFGATNATGDGFAKIDPNNTTGLVDLNVFGGTSGGSKTFATAIASEIYINYGTAALRTDANNTYGLQILNYASASSFKPFSLTASYLNTSSARVNETQQGTIRTASAITSLVITNPTGNWSTGTVLVYGVK